MTFNNNSSQKERRQVIRNDATTLHDFAQSAAGEISGRWAKPATVNASEQAAHYPRLPTSSPWSNPIEAVEPPLGFSVEETPIVGEYAEVQASLDRDFELQRSLRDGAATPASGRLIPDGGDVARFVNTLKNNSNKNGPHPIGRGPLDRC